MIKMYACGPRVYINMRDDNWLTGWGLCGTGSSSLEWVRLYLRQSIMLYRRGFGSRVVAYNVSVYI